MPSRPAANAPARVARARGRSRGAARESHTAPRGALGELPREHVAGIQRSRLLAGAVEAIQKEGLAATTVAQITGYAKVSRRTFYELFEDREDCVLALVDDVLATLRDELARQELSGLPWRERVRAGLTVILEFFDREPALARICVVGSLHGGPCLLEQREAALESLVDAIDAGHPESHRSTGCTRLTAEGLVGAAAAIVHTRLARGRREPLLDLVGELMGMIVLPYLGAAAARSEVARAAQPVAAARAVPARLSPDPLRSLSMRVTYRTARVLQGIARHPGASNRQVADGAGIRDQGQVSKLLSRLERLGLIGNRVVESVKGEPNAWELTPLGEQVVQRLGVGANGDGQPVSGEPGQDIATADERRAAVGGGRAGSRRRQRGGATDAHPQI